MNLLPFTPLVMRHASPHGQGTITYSEFQGRPGERIYPQDAPDPIRQGDTPARHARMPIVCMSTNPADWNSGFAEAFLPYARSWIPRYQHAGKDRQLAIRSTNPVGSRVNIDRGHSVAYGSLFSLAGGTYEEVRS